MVLSQAFKRMYIGKYNGMTVAVKVRPHAQVAAEAEVLRLMATDDKSHAVAVVAVIPRFDDGDEDETGSDDDESAGDGKRSDDVELAALVTEYAPGHAFWETEAEARRFLVDLLEVRYNATRVCVGQVASRCTCCAQGVHTWHKHGYLHRDVKPDNLSRRADGRLVILDADIAKRIADCSTEEPLGRTPKHVAGTTGYIDPRVARGEVDWSPAAELFSIGATLRQVRDVRVTCGRVFLTSRLLLQLISDSWEMPLNDAVHCLAGLLCAKDSTKRPCLGALLGVPCRDTNSEPCDGTPETCLYGSSLRAADLAEVCKALGLMAAALQAAE